MGIRFVPFASGNQRQGEGCKINTELALLPDKIGVHLVRHRIAIDARENKSRGEVTAGLFLDSALRRFRIERDSRTILLMLEVLDLVKEGPPYGEDRLSQN